MTADRTGTGLLLAATLLVAISIVLDGAASRLFNGLGGIAWFASAGLLALAAWRTRAAIAPWALATGLTILLAFVVTPSDFARAIAGFGAAGVAIALVAGRNEALWAKVVVGLYLPLHVGTAILKAVWRSMTDGESSIRTDPPPTAALVPFAMFVAALAGALLVTWWRGRTSSAGERGKTHVTA